MEQNTDTPPETLALATVEDMLPMGRLTLLGTIITSAEPRALVRTASGRVRSVKVGARLGSGKVVAIDQGALVVQNANDTTRLAIPPDGNSKATSLS